MQMQKHGVSEEIQSGTEKKNSKYIACLLCALPNFLCVSVFLAFSYPHFA